jgi:hypothetical protein
MPDVVVANKGAIASPRRDRGILNEALFKEVEGGLVAKSLEGAITPVTGP